MRQSVPATIGVVLAALLALGGLAVSTILLQHHLVVEIGGNPIFGGLCRDIGGQSDCDKALTSPWSKMVLGEWAGRLEIPTAMFGFVFFACMSSWYIVVGRASGSRRGLHLLPVLGAALGALICVWLDVVMWVKLGGACWLCLAVHVISWVLLLVTLLLWPRESVIAGPVVASVPGGGVRTGLPRRAEMASHPPMHLVLAAALLAIATSAAGWWKYQAERYRAEWQAYDQDYLAAYARFMSQPQVEIPIVPDDPIRGPVDAPHTVVVFTDFQCPFCRGAAEMLQQRMKEFPGKFRIVFKHFPMNTTCNDYVQNTLHKASCGAAVTAEAARLLGGTEAFWKMHDELFRNADVFARDSDNFVRQTCQKLGLDYDALWAKIKTYTIWEHIRVNTGQGNALEVDGTPTIFFDGRRMLEWGNKHTWRFLIENRPVPPTQPAEPVAKPVRTTPSPDAAQTKPSPPIPQPNTPATTAATTRPPG